MAGNAVSPSMHARLLDHRPIVADGYHNAFTDLCFWDGCYYVAYRQAQRHSIAPPGRIIILRSAYGDTKTWKQCASIATGGDDRDPKFFQTKGKLGIFFGTYYPRWQGHGVISNTAHDLVSHYIVSRDGECWSAPVQMYRPNYWIWSMKNIDGTFFALAYHFGNDGSGNSIWLLQTPDLLSWQSSMLIQSRRFQFSEPTLYRSGEDELSCIVRDDLYPEHAIRGLSSYPYESWEWAELETLIHAPSVASLYGTHFIAGRGRVIGRDTYREYCTALWEIVENTAQRILTLPSGKDCSYPGMVSKGDDTLLMSYYSQHERPECEVLPHTADIYIAEIQVQKIEESGHDMGC